MSKAVQFTTGIVAFSIPSSVERRKTDASVEGDESNLEKQLPGAMEPIIVHYQAHEQGSDAANAAPVG